MTDLKELAKQLAALSEDEAAELIIELAETHPEAKVWDELRDLFNQANTVRALRSEIRDRRHN